MPTVFEAGYEDHIPGERSRAEKRCAAAKARLARAGICAHTAADPPWMDAGNLSGYFQDCSWGRVWVTVADADLARARAILGEQEA